MDEERIRFHGAATLSRDADKLKKTSCELKARHAGWIHQDRATQRRDDGATVLSDGGATGWRRAAARRDDVPRAAGQG